MFGWIKDDYDPRDKIYSFAKPAEEFSYINLIKELPDVYDQLTLGSCVAQGIAAQFYQLLYKQKLHKFTPSRLKIYYEGRKAINLINQDSGMTPRDGVKIVAKQGGCDEKLWPYVISKFKEQPPAECYEQAELHQVLEYHRLHRDLNSFKQCLIDGFTFGMGMEVYESMFSKNVKLTGWVPMPKPKEKSLGGHYVVVVGFDDRAKVFIVRNSWSASWGMGGHFALGYDYLLSERLTDDFWTLRLIEE